MPRMRTRAVPGGLLLLGLALLSLTPVARGATTWEVTIVDFSFNPSPLQIAVGDSVHWTNQDGVTHTVTSGTSCQQNGIFNSGSLASGHEFGWRFNTDGSFPYFCIPHCSGGMTGLVTVVPNTAAQPETWGRIRSLYR